MRSNESMVTHLWRYVIFPYVIIPNVTIPRVVKIPNKYANPKRNNPETFYVKIPKLFT